jgi:hypothetical protein
MRLTPQARFGVPHKTPAKAGAAPAYVSPATSLCHGDGRFTRESRGPVPRGGRSAAAPKGRKRVARGASPGRPSREPRAASHEPRRTATAGHGMPPATAADSPHPRPLSPRGEGRLGRAGVGSPAWQGQGHGGDLPLVSLSLEGEGGRRPGEGGKGSAGRVVPGNEEGVAAPRLPGPPIPTAPLGLGAVGLRTHRAKKDTVDCAWGSCAAGAETRRAKRRCWGMRLSGTAGHGVPCPYERNGNSHGSGCPSPPPPLPALGEATGLRCAPTGRGEVGGAASLLIRWARLSPSIPLPGGRGWPQAG